MGNVSKVLGQQSDHFKMHVIYATKLIHILNVFAECRKDKKLGERLAEYLRQKENERNSLIHLFVIPIQRISYYVSVLNELETRSGILSSSQSGDQSDYEEVVNALRRVGAIWNDIIKKETEIENVSECALITHRLTGLNINIIEPSRQFIHHFVFKKKVSGHNKQFILFNDMVLIADERWKMEEMAPLNKFEAKQVMLTSED